MWVWVDASQADAAPRLDEPVVSQCQLFVLPRCRRSRSCQGSSTSVCRGIVVDTGRIELSRQVVNVGGCTPRLALVHAVRANTASKIYMTTPL